MSSYLYEVEVCEGLSDNCPVMMVICIMDRCLPEIVQENMKVGVLMKQKKMNMKQFFGIQYVNHLLLTYFTFQKCVKVRTFLKPPLILDLNTISFCKTKMSTLEIYGHADCGPRSMVCARKTLCSAPYRHERIFYAACVCRIIF